MIAHPPCTYLAGSGARWLTQTPARPRPDVLYGAARQAARDEAVVFVRALHDADVPRVAIENPVSMLSSLWRRPDQTLQPWQYGHGEVKATCLWLRNLPALRPTLVLPPEGPNGEDWREAKVHRMSPGPDRAKMRSRTYRGIADAMATQWGRLLDRDERGSISGDIAAAVMAAVVLVFLALLLVAWWAPEAHATRPIPGARPADMCQNVRGVQTLADVLRRSGDYRVTHVVVRTRDGKVVARICREVRR